MLIAGLLVELASAVVFVLWPAPPGLLVARVICGVGVGLVTASATAYLSELSHRAGAATPRVPADIVATAANLGGLSLGPLIAGALAQFVVKPLLVPYWISGALLVLAAVAVRLVPETVIRHHRPYRPQRVAVPAAARTPYFGAAAEGFVAFG